MRVFRTHAFARAGLVGNPSDGYHGRTISLIVRDFRAEAVIYDWPEIEIMPTPQDQCRFANLPDLLADLKMNGYYGGMRLVKGAIKRFAEYCRAEDIELPPRNFSIRYNSNIPRQVGLAGSSAIVTATLRALCRFYDVHIDEDILPGLILSVESRELGIGAGLQDRVAQVFEGLVYMDFDKEYMDAHGHGRYERLDPALLPPVFIAYQQNLAESSEVFHNDIRRRYDSGEREVIDAINRIAELARLGREALLSGDAEALGALINENFDLRQSIYRLNPKHVEMVEIARSLGFPAHFAGSGGSVLGLYDTAESFQRLERAFALRDCRLIKPVVGGQWPVVSDQ